MDEFRQILTEITVYQ